MAATIEIGIILINLIFPKNCDSEFCSSLNRVEN